MSYGWIPLWHRIDQKLLGSRMLTNARASVVISRNQQIVTRPVQLMYSAYYTAAALHSYVVSILFQPTLVIERLSTTLKPYCKAAFVMT